MYVCMSLLIGVNQEKPGSSTVKLLKKEIPKNHNHLSVRSVTESISDCVLLHCIPAAFAEKVTIGRQK